MRARLTAGLVVLGAAGLWSFAQEGCGSTPKPPATPATGSGAFGVVTVNGKQELFLPVKGLNDAGDGQIVVVDVGVSGSGVNDAGVLVLPAQVANIDLGDAGKATATAGDATVVIAAGTQTYTVWFIDPTTNKVTDTIQLDPSLNQASFSGGSGLVNGIAIDEANHRAILSVWNGLQFVDLGSHKVTGTVLAAGAENFGYDSSREYVLAPFYDCAATGTTGDEDGGGATPPPCSSYVTVGDAGGIEITDGLNLINLNTDKVYTFENPDAGSPAEPFGSSPDSAAVDPSTGLAIVPSEFSGFYTFLDLSKAVFSFNGDAGIFTAPSTTLLPASSDDGVAVDPASHLAFCELEFEDHLSVIDLTKVNTSVLGVGPGAFADAYLPNLPDGNMWENLGDPHGIAVTTGIQTGSPVGFVVTDRSDEGTNDIWVARVDLNMMLTLGTKAASDAGVMSLSPVMFAPAVTFLDATHKE
jgi:hypothetical protein